MLGFTPVARLVGADEVPFVPGKIRSAVIRLYLCAALVALGEDVDADAAIIDVPILRFLVRYVEVRRVGRHRGRFGIVRLSHLGRPLARLRVQMDALELIEMTSQTVAGATLLEGALREVERHHHRHGLSIGERALVAQ